MRERDWVVIRREKSPFQRSALLRSRLLAAEKRTEVCIFPSFLLGRFLKVLSEEGLQLCSSLRTFSTQVKKNTHTHTHALPHTHTRIIQFGAPGYQASLINHSQSRKLRLSHLPPPPHPFPSESSSGKQTDPRWLPSFLPSFPPSLLASVNFQLHV